MASKERTRLQVLNSLLAEHMTLEQAATLMGISERQTRRILAAYREEGAVALAHGHRGGGRPTQLRSVSGLTRSTWPGPSIKARVPRQAVLPISIASQ